MTAKEILNTLREEKPYLQEKFGLLSIGLFGSYAKGISGPRSDVDLLVEFKEPRFDYFAGLQIYLEKRLDKPVELVRKRQSLSHRFLIRIEQSIIYV